MIELTINFVFKFIHMTGMMLGAASGFGMMLLARQARLSGGISPDIAALRPRFAKLALLGISLLWISGLGLWMFRYDLVDLGAAYSLKLLIALVLFAIIVLVNTLNIRAKKNGTLPPSWLPKLGMTTPVLMFAAMGLGVWIFI